VSAGNYGRGRTSGRKGRLDGHFHPKTAVMTSLPWSDIFKPTTSDKPTKKKTSPPRL
jgi:hypothetical protein